jgi:hypothetical protein
MMKEVQRRGENRVGLRGVTTLSLARKEKFFGVEMRWLRGKGDPIGDKRREGETQKLVNERGVLLLIIEAVCCFLTTPGVYWKGTCET